MPSYLKILGRVQTPHVVIIAAAAVNAKNFLVFQTNTTITSGEDGQHMEGSKHYSDNALDFRTNDMTITQVEQWADEMRKRLGLEYQVIVERDHLHVEWDPH